MTKNFLGKWEMLSEKSLYGKGIPPQSAIYEFKKAENSINISINWIDYEGKNFEIQYNIAPDGQRKKLESPEADEIMSEFVSEYQLNTSVYKNGSRIALTTRSIDSELIMEVVQKFYPSEGEPYENIQYYKK